MDNTALGFTEDDINRMLANIDAFTPEEIEEMIANGYGTENSEPDPPE